jgi:hypothetical protein
MARQTREGDRKAGAIMTPSTRWCPMCNRHRPVLTPHDEHLVTSVCGFCGHIHSMTDDTPKKRNQQ